MSKINVTVEFQLERHMDTFINMLAWMELCGNIGHNTGFIVNLDGDGNARPKFTFDDPALQERFDVIRKGSYRHLQTAPNVRNVINADVEFRMD